MLDWHKLKEYLLNQFDVDEEAIAVDSTGFTPSLASAYFQSRTGKTIGEYVKSGYAVATQSQLVLGWRIASTHNCDVTFLPNLRRQASRYGRHTLAQRAWVLLGDKGFDGNTVQPGDLIPPIRRGGNLSAPDRRARADMVAAARLDGLYGQRWKCETVNSVIKRQFVPPRCVCNNASQPSER